MTSLFPDLPPSISPRKAWVEKYGILTHWFDDAEPGQRCMAIIPLLEDKAAGRDVADCMAHNCRRYDEGGLIGYGDTLTEALTALAVIHGLKLWNEEDPE